MVRTFIAVDFDNEIIKKNVKHVQEELKTANADLKFVDPSIIHITLEFLGEIDEKRVDDVINCMKTIDFEPFSVRLEGLGVFPNENYLRVIYTPGHSDKPDYLSVIRNELHNKLKKLGFKLDSKPFKPHLTIARVKTAKNKQNLLSVIKKLHSVKIGEQKINKIKLKKSVLTPQGPKYTTLFEVETKNG